MKQTAPIEPAEGPGPAVSGEARRLSPWTAAHRSFGYEITGTDFEGWPLELIEESKHSDANGRVGTRLLLESSVARIWVIELKPGERLPFHRHVLNYFWTVLTIGRACSRTPDGVTRHIWYQPKDNKHLTFRKGEGMIHDLENIGETDLVFVTVELVQSENAPLNL